jgi:hypothetical protein
MKFGSSLQLLLLWQSLFASSTISTIATAFVSPTNKELALSAVRTNAGAQSCSSMHRTCTVATHMAGGDGSDSEWAKALQENNGMIPGQFEKDMKMKGLLGKNKGSEDPKVTANGRLVQWLEEEGDVYLKETSGFGEAP